MHLVYQDIWQYEYVPARLAPNKFSLKANIFLPLTLILILFYYNWLKTVLEMTWLSYKILRIVTNFTHIIIVDSTLSLRPILWFITHYM